MNDTTTRREAVIRCDELKERTRVTLLPAESIASGVGELIVDGLKEPVRVWLRPGTENEEAFDRFCRSRLVPGDRETVRRSSAWEAWNMWSAKHAPKTMLEKAIFLGYMSDRHGIAVKRAGIWVFRGAKLSGE